MLNYFLLQLVGPQRKSLSLKDPEKYEFRPKHLLKQVGITFGRPKGKYKRVLLYSPLFPVILLNAMFSSCAFLIALQA